MYNPKSLKAEEFISDDEIRDTIRYADENKNSTVQKMCGAVFLLAKGVNL